MRLIICEGVDSTGKSTLASQLAVRMNACYHHASGHKSLHFGMYEHHKNILDCAEINLANGHNVVLDRHWPSEFCYASVLRPELVDKYKFGEMVDRLGRLGSNGQHTVHYIHCRPRSMQSGWGRYEQTHQDHDQVVFRRLSEQEYYAIAGEYDYLFRGQACIKYTIEDGPTLVNIVNLIEGGIS